MCSTSRVESSHSTGCPIRIQKAHRLHAAPLLRFAGLRVLLRQVAPRHPPRTLCSFFCTPRSLLLWKERQGGAQGKNVTMLFLLGSRSLIFFMVLLSDTLCANRAHAAKLK